MRITKSIYSMCILVLMALLAAGTVVFAEEGETSGSYSLTINKKIDLTEINESERQAVINEINKRDGYTFKIVGTVGEQEVEKIVPIKNFKLQDGYGISSAKVDFGSPATISVIELITPSKENNAKESRRRRTPIYDSQAPVATPSDSINKDEAEWDSSEIPIASPSDLATGEKDSWNLFSIFRNSIATPSNIFRPETATPSRTSKRKSAVSSEPENTSSFQIADSGGNIWNMTSPQFQSSMNVNNSYAILSISKDNGRIQIRKPKANNDDENTYTFKITQTDFNDHDLKEYYSLDVKAGESGELTDLPRGYYRVEEEKAPNGFFLEVKNPNIQIKPEDSGDIKISDGNSKLTITAGGRAGDGDSHYFTVTGPNGYQKNDIIIESQGNYVLKQLPPGDYTIKETTYAGTGGFTVETTTTSSSYTTTDYTFEKGYYSIYNTPGNPKLGDYIRVSVSNIKGPVANSNLVLRLKGIWCGSESDGLTIRDFKINNFQSNYTYTVPSESSSIKPLSPGKIYYKFYDSNGVTSCKVKWTLYKPRISTTTSKTGVEKTVTVDKRGQMTITKPADDNDRADHVTYHFTVTNTETNAVYKLDLKSGESKQLNNLEAGKYTVAETLIPRGPVGFSLSEEDKEAPNQYSSTVTGTVKGSESIMILKKPASAGAIGGRINDNGGRLYHYTITSPDGGKTTVALKAGEEKSLAELLGVNKLNQGDYTISPIDDTYSGFGMTYNDSRTVAIVDRSDSAVVNITNTYTREEGSYRVIHEYYYDDGTGRTLEGKSDIVMRPGQELNSVHTSKNVTQVPNYGGHVYGYIGPVYGEMLWEDDKYSSSDYDVIPDKESVTATKDGEEIIILRYVRTPFTRPAGTYKIVHEYYFLDQAGQHLEGRSSIEEAEGILPVNMEPAYTGNDVEKKYYSDVSGVYRKYKYLNTAYGLYSHLPTESYSPSSGKDCVYATENGEEIIIIRYVRAAAFYNVVHEYYLRVPANMSSDNSVLDSESDTTTDSEIESGAGNEEADVSDEIFDYKFEGRRNIEIVGAPVDSTHTGDDVEQIFNFAPQDKEYVYKHYEFGYGFLNESADGYSCDMDKDLVFSTEAGNEIIILRYYREDRIPDEPDKPDKPDTPGPGGSGDDDDDDDDDDHTPDNPKSETPANPDTPETTGTTETITPDTPDGNTPDRPAELPDPNDPDSPERITIWENGVPRTYVKTWDPVTQQWTYILDTDTPLDRMMLPKTGGRTQSGMMAFLCLASLGGICIALRRRKTDED